MISKKTFVEIVSLIESQVRLDESFADTSKQFFEDCYPLVYNNYSIKKAIEVLLRETFKDSDGWIDYFFWELDFGKLYEDGMITCDDEVVSIKNPSDLYDFLISNYNLKWD